MPDFEACDHAAAESGLGRRIQVHRVLRHVSYPLRVLLYGAIVAIGTLATQGSPWGLVAAAIVMVCTETTLWFAPPSRGVTAMVRYEGGLACVTAGGRFDLLPWTVIEGCAYQPAATRQSVGTTRIYFAQFRLYLRGLPRPLVLMHLRKAGQLAAATAAAIRPIQLRQLHQRLARDGRLDLGGKLVVTPAGLIIGTSPRYQTSPLPWNRLTRVDIAPPSTVVLQATSSLDPDYGDARVSVDGSAALAAQFIVELWEAARRTEQAGGAPAHS